MEDQTVNPSSTANAIPDAGSVEAQGIGGAWRFAEGAIRRGRKGAFENYPRDKVVGILRRVGIHSGIKESDNMRFMQVEADIETSFGLEFFKSNLYDDKGNLSPSTATIGFAWGLTQLKAGDQVMITTALGKETDKGGIPTYVNVWHSPNNDWKFTQLMRPKRDKNAPKYTMDEQWTKPGLLVEGKSLKDAIEAHPAFAERPADRDGDDDAKGDTHLKLLIKECAEKGWPTPEQHPAVWLQKIATASSHAVRSKLSDYSDDEWGQIRLMLQQATEMPEFLKDVATAKQQSIAI